MLSDRSRFRQIFDNTNKKLFAFACKHTGDHSLAQDIVQNAYMKLWENLESIRNSEAIEAYLFKVVINSVKQEYKKLLLTQEAYQYYSEICEVDSCYKPDDEKVTDLAKQIDRLPPKQKQVFCMHRFEGLTYKEISSYLNVSEGTIEKQIHSALVKIRKGLTKKNIS